MRLLEDDVMHVLSQIPYQTLAKHGAAKRYIDLLVRDGIELETTLAQFPAVQYEPLEQHYALIRALGGLTEDLVSDLCAHYTWRGVVWASFLVALAPDTRHRRYLTEARERATLNQWLVDLALSEIDGTVWLFDTELQDQIHRLRTVLSIVPIPATSLRRAPSGMQLLQVEAERERVKAAYQAGGLEAALREVRKTEVLRSMGAKK